VCVCANSLVVRCWATHANVTIGFIPCYRLVGLTD